VSVYALLFQTVKIGAAGVSSPNVLGAGEAIFMQIQRRGARNINAYYLLELLCTKFF